MQFDKGYLSPHFITDPKAMECVLENPMILIHEKKISSVKDMIPLLEEVMRSSGRPLVIIAEDIEGEALATLVVNRLRGAFPCVAVKAPGLRRSPQGDDGGHRGILTGANPVMKSTASSLEVHHDGKDLGKAKKVVVTKDNTTIIEGAGKKTRDQGPHRARSAPRSRTRSRTTTARSSRSAWPSSPAVSPRSTSAPRRKPR